MFRPIIKSWVNRIYLTLHTLKNLIVILEVFCANILYFMYSFLCFSTCNFHLLLDLNWNFIKNFLLFFQSLLNNFHDSTLLRINPGFKISLLLLHFRDQSIDIFTYNFIYLFDFWLKSLFLVLKLIDT